MYYFNLYLHILSAFLWLGGMLFFAAVAAPILRRVEPPSLRSQLFTRLGEGFRVAGWIAITILLITGVANLAFRGWLESALQGNAAFWSSRPGRMLIVKLSCVFAMVVLGAIHDFVLGPRAGRLEAGSPEATRVRRQAAWLARANAILGLILIFASLRLARGG